MRNISLINIGSGNFAVKEKILVVLKPESSPVKRLIKEAKDSGKLLDGTAGKKTRSVVVMDGGYVVLCPVLPETIAEKFKKNSDQDILNDD